MTPRARRVGSIVILWATEDGSNEGAAPAAVWPGYALAALSFMCAVFHGVAVCALSSRDRERQMVMFTTLPQREPVEPPMPDSAV